MPDASSDSPSHAKPIFDIDPKARLFMVACGYIPFLHVGAVITCLVWAAMGSHGLWPALAAVVVLYVLPPAVVRFLLNPRQVSAGTYPLDSRLFRLWWFTAQWQVVFNRLPFLEEALRLVPGLYSAWLRLWGSEVGRFVYWSPGTVLLDRSLVAIGDRVVFGVTSRLHPHLIDRNEDGDVCLYLGAVRIGDDAMVGGMSVLAPGVYIESGEIAPGVYALPPFAHWRGGRRVRHNTATIR